MKNMTRNTKPRAKKVEYLRLNKLIATRTQYSRREADELIKSGVVSIDGKIVTQMGESFAAEVPMSIYGKEVPVPTGQYTVIVYNKPKGELVTKKDPRGRRTIYDSLGEKFAGFIPVGRLDFASEGLLMLTDSTKVANALMNSELGRVYNITIAGSVTEAMKEAMLGGLELEDAKAGAHAKTKQISMSFAPFLGYKIKKESHAYSKLSVMLSEGQNREIRRFFGHFSVEVLDLKRVGFGWVDLSALPTGEWRYIKPKEYDELRNFLKDDNAKKDHAKN